MTSFALNIYTLCSCALFCDIIEPPHFLNVLVFLVLTGALFSQYVFFIHCTKTSS